MHFATEEKYFDEFKYEGAEEHKAEHRKLEKSVADMQKRAKAGDLTFTVELLDFFEDWLIKHLAEMDQKYVKCFNEHGLR